MWSPPMCDPTMLVKRRSASLRSLLWWPDGELWLENHGIEAPEGHRTSENTPPTLRQHAQKLFDHFQCDSQYQLRGHMWHSIKEGVEEENFDYDGQPAPLLRVESKVVFISP